MNDYEIIMAVLGIISLVIACLSLGVMTGSKRKQIANPDKVTIYL